MTWKWGGDLSQIWIIVVLLLDPQQHGGVPLIQARNAVVVFHSIGKSVNVLLFEMLDENLKWMKNIMKCTRGDKPPDNSA